MMASPPKQVSDIPSDVLFAQKASAIVQAAGMDPCLMDLEKFRQIAHKVFARAFIAIYKETPADFIDDPKNQDDLVFNAQLILSALHQKSGKKILTEITGQDLCLGSHRAIGILVGILFSEGQRLWLEGVKQKISNNQEIFRDNEPEQQQYQMRTDDDPQTARLSSPLQESIRRRTSNQRPKSASRVRTSIGRIYDENQVYSKGYDQMDSLSSGNYTKPKLVRSDLRQKLVDEGDPIVQDSEMLRQRLKDLESKLKGQAVMNTYEEPVLIQNPAFASGRMNRPSSAPSKRKVKNPIERVYSNISLNQALMSRTNAEFFDQPNKQKVEGSTLKIAGNNKNNGMYPNDKNGRKVESQTQSQLDKYLKSENQQKLKAQKGAVTSFEDHVRIELPTLPPKRNALSPPHSPTKAAWPNGTTEKSAEEWIRRARVKSDVIRSEPHHKPFVVGAFQHHDFDGPLVLNNQSDASQYAIPRFYRSYNMMQEMDLIISVEHCFNCEHHNISLRHNPDEYLHNADSLLRLLVQVAYSSSICARVGVVRFLANISPKSKQSDANSRIGAFEVQVAYRSSSGQIIPELIHSKLCSRRWPSKSVIEKRFKSFLTKMSVRTHERLPSDSTASASAVEWISEELGSYPVGIVAWDDLEFANPGWCYPETAAPAGGKPLLFIRWAFNTAGLSQFAVGTKVRVLGGSIPKKFAVNSERHALLGTVIGSDEYTKELVVHLKYFDVGEGIIRIAESDAVKIDNYVSTVPKFSDPNVMPPALNLLFYLVSHLPVLEQWRSQQDGDLNFMEASGVHLTRNQFYIQARSLAAKVEQMNTAGLFTKMNQGCVCHPLIGEWVDIQESYSEEILDWIFEIHDVSDSANITQLIRTAAIFFHRLRANIGPEVAHAQLSSNELFFTDTTINIESIDLSGSTLMDSCFDRLQVLISPEGYLPILLDCDIQQRGTQQRHISCSTGTNRLDFIRLTGEKIEDVVQVMVSDSGYSLSGTVSKVLGFQPGFDIRLASDSGTEICVNRSRIRISGSHPVVGDTIYATVNEGGSLTQGLVVGRNINDNTYDLLFEEIADIEIGVSVANIQYISDDDLAASNSFIEGESVDVNWMGYGTYYTAKIAAVKTSITKIDVNYISNGSSQHTETINSYENIQVSKRITALPYSTEDLVEVERPGGGSVMGKVLLHQGNLKYKIIFTDGTIEDNISHAVLRSVKIMEQYTIAARSIREALVKRAGGSDADGYALVKRLFKELDNDGNGVLRIEELKTFFQSPELAALRDNKTVDINCYYDLVVEQIDTDRFAPREEIDIPLQLYFPHKSRISFLII